MTAHRALADIVERHMDFLPAPEIAQPGDVGVSLGGGKIK